MDTPICVIDAKTFIDHIQEIKRWIYDGRMRLVVPSCTTEVVEQLYQKSIEINPTPSEPTRPRSFGRQPRKEHPAFDINPRLARDFLARLKPCKEINDSVSGAREFYRGKENHDSVEFQLANEQYTVWKDLDTAEEEGEEVLPIVAPPTSWAEALRRKANMDNGSLEGSQAPKGPVKPKLVARAPGSDQSPWKIKKDAPKISAKDVPSVLRPLMSCALWRLHEHIDRNDTNELFLLSDQTEMRTVAEKLNIIVRTPQEVKQLLASKTEKTDLATFGDLEREFGIQPKTSLSAGSYAGMNVPHRAGGPRERHAQSEAKSKKTSLDGENGRLDADTLLDNEDRSQAETKEMLTRGGILTEKQSLPFIEARDSKALGQEPLAESTTNGSVTTSTTKPAWGEVIKDSSYSIKNALENGRNVDAFMTTKMHNALPQDTLTQETQKDLETTSTFDSTSIAPSVVEMIKPVMPEEGKRSQTPTTPALTDAARTVTLKQSIQTEELEDSDEDVVVFKPSAKRYSTQRKHNQQHSRPSTPVTPAQQQTSTPFIPTQQKAVGENSIAAMPKPQAQLRPTSSHGRQPIVVSHGHPQTKTSPMIIDPDAFGRSFAVNTNPSPSPRALHNPRSHHHHPRPPHHAQQVQASRSPHREHARMGSAQQTHKEASQRSSPPLGSKREKSPRSSPSRRSRVFEPEKIVSTAFDPMPGAGLRPTKPGSKRGEVDSSVPRSTDSGLQMRPFEAPEFVPRSQMTGAQPKIVLPPPVSFEPGDDFVPRSTMSQPLYKPRASESEYIEPRASTPDVQYFLKSGSTRASARGRGRLWTPS